MINDIILVRVLIMYSEYLGFWVIMVNLYIESFLVL